MKYHRKQPCKMVLTKICLLWLLLQGQFIFTVCHNTTYTVEGSTLNLIFKVKSVSCYFKGRNTNITMSRKNEYSLQLHPEVIEMQLMNVTTSDTGVYSLYNATQFLTVYNYPKALDVLCLPYSARRECAMKGTTKRLKFTTNGSIYHDTYEVDYRPQNSRSVSNFTIQLVIYIYDVAQDDIGPYECYQYFDHDRIILHVARLWFINQTDTKRIVGQEGTIMVINCHTDTSQYITALKIESNGSIKAIGDNKFVRFAFIPDRTDHLTKYRCVESTNAAIMVEVELTIRYAPAVTARYTNEMIECVCNGYPVMYSVYRLDQISKYGKIVRSINLNTEIVAFTTFPFPYQRNGIYMCVVSNGIPDTNGNDLQKWSINVKYEGPPVFAHENRNVKTGEVGQSLTLSFRIYSYPAIEEIFIETIGRKPTDRKKIIKYNILESTLNYTEFGNIIGIDGYEVFIESEVLDIDDFQAFRIIAKNVLGEGYYHFDIIDNGCSENVPVSESKRMYFVILCSIATILFVHLIIIHVYLCVKHIKTRNQRHDTVEEDGNYHMYHEIGTISYRAVTNSRPSDTNDNQGQNLAIQQAPGVSTRVNMQSNSENTTELNADLLVDELQQHETTEVQRQHMSISSDDTNLSNVSQSRTPSIVIPSVDDGESSDQKSHSSNDSDSGSSNNVMVGNVGDGYENPYQTILQDCPETHQYMEIMRERHNSMSSAESNNLEQTLEKKLTKEAVYINLQL